MTEESPGAGLFRAAATEFFDVTTANMAVRRFGSGPPLLMIHGWPLSGFTWRHVIPRLAATRTCIVPDSPGAGDTTWHRDHDFRFRGQAETYARLLDEMGIREVDVLAHDTGATIARELALVVGARVRTLALVNTEIPGHRPPFIPLFQKITRLPGARRMLRLMMRSRSYRRSSAGLGGCFSDRSRLDGEFHDAFIRPLIESSERTEGQLRYLQGIDWKLVDSLASRHREIEARVVLLWGEDDPTFPIAKAREMVPQFTHCVGLRAIAGGKLLVHEERPDLVVDHTLEHLDG